MDRLKVCLDHVLLLVEDLELNNTTHESSQNLFVLGVPDCDDIFRILSRLSIAPSQVISTVGESEIAFLAFDVVVIKKLHKLIHNFIALRIQSIPLKTSRQLHRLCPLVLSWVNLLYDSLLLNLL